MPPSATTEYLSQNFPHRLYQIKGKIITEIKCNEYKSQLFEISFCFERNGDFSNCCTYEKYYLTYDCKDRISFPVESITHDEL